MSSLPHVNDRVDVAVREGRWLASRVEDRDDDVLFLAEPLDTRGRAGQAMTVRWVTGRGVAEVRCTLEARVDHGAMAVWRLRPTADVAIQQRRRFVRARVLLPVDIEFEEGLGLQRVPATSVDISEGGIQLVTLGKDDVAVGRAVVIAVELEGEEIRLNGDVLQCRPRENGTRTVIVRFVGVRSGDADRVRRFVFRAQLDSLVDEAR